MEEMLFVTVSQKIDKPEFVFVSSIYRNIGEAEEFVRRFQESSPEYKTWIATPPIF